MLNIKKILSIGLALSFIITGANNYSNQFVKKADAAKNKVSIKLYKGKKNITKKKITIKKGTKFTLKVKTSVKAGKICRTFKSGNKKIAKVTKNGKVNSSLTFKSGNKKIAKVTKKGKVTALKKGNTKITVTFKYNKKKYKTFFKLVIKNKNNNSYSNPTTPAASTNPLAYDDWSIIASEGGVTFKDKNVESFVKANMDFSINTFKSAIKKDINNGENAMIAPISVNNAMSMVMNGANGQTFTELNNAICNGMDISLFNEKFKEFNAHLSSDNYAKVNIANSLWLRKMDSLTLNSTFSDLVKENYNATVNVRDFNDDTVNEINKWVKENTNDMIDKIVDNLGAQEYMHIINATAFEGNWTDPFYKDNTVENADFTSYTGSVSKVSMMHGGADKYIETENSKGFIKGYLGGNFSFVALLPDKGTDIKDYVNSVSGDSFRKIISSASSGYSLSVGVPKFKHEYKIELNDALQQNGIKNAFSSNADFSNLLSLPSKIDKVNHKTFIEVDEKGTRAAAVTDVVMKANSILKTEHKEVILDRPFVYAIIDNKTSLPLFMGVMNK